MPSTSLRVVANRVREHAEDSPAYTPNMSAYVIVRVRVSDPAQYEKYKALSPGAVEEYGGTFIVRGGASEVLEGEPDDRRIVVLQFPTVDAAKAFYNSERYTHAREVRAGAAEMEMVVVEGL